MLPLNYKTTITKYDVEEHFSSCLCPGWALSELDVWFPACEASVKPKTKKEKLKEMFPALCRANDPAPEVCASTSFLHLLYFTNPFRTVVNKLLTLDNNTR